MLPSSPNSHDKATEIKWSACCYIPGVNFLVCLVTAVRMVESDFCNFHVRQGLGVFVAWILTAVISAFSETFGLMLLGIVLLLHGVGIFSAIRYQKIEIPVLGPFFLQIPRYYIYGLLTGSEPENK